MSHARLLYLRIAVNDTIFPDFTKIPEKALEKTKETAMIKKKLTGSHCMGGAYALSGTAKRIT